MKKIIAFAMSALLAVSAVAIPVSADPAIPDPTPDRTQARQVCAEEFARVRPRKTETTSMTEEAEKLPLAEITVSSATEEKLSAATETEVDPGVQVEPPVPAQITGSMVILEYREGYEYRVTQTHVLRDWQTDNVFDTLSPNMEYLCQQRLAGRPETESEAVVIVTKDWAPCSVPPAAPIVKTLGSTQITLVEREGYEYRLNDGKWQNTGVFLNVEPDTEYIVYQRVKQTRSEYASEPTQLRVRTPEAVGPSSDRNYDQLVEYIKANGFEDENGVPTLAYYIPADASSLYYFVLSCQSSYILCNTFSISEDPTFIAFDTSFQLYKSWPNMEPSCDLYMCYNGEYLDYIEARVNTTYKTYYTDFSFKTVYGSSDYLSNDLVSQMFNNTMAMLCGFWDETLYNALGFGLKGLGFLAYDGMGELSCDPGTQFHAGEPVTVGQREPGCEIDGNEGDQICSACGVTMVYGSPIPATGSHQYTNACDRDCNVCGEIRRVQHIYGRACDTQCDICGAERIDPLASHTPASNRICTKCGQPCRLSGDVSGDGKVNAGDVARAYAHVRGSALLTDPDDLSAADTNGDGKINMGDVSRIFAHVTGSMLLW